MIEVKDFAGGINGIPQHEDRMLMWENLSITRVDRDSPSLATYIEHLQQLLVNGEVKYACFELGESEVLDWYVSRNQLKECLFFQDLWQQDEIKKTFGFENVDDDVNQYFDWSSPFVLGGSFAWVLSTGGPYYQPGWSGTESKRLGEAAANDIIEDNYEHCLVHECGYGWCSFFNDLAWDSTWIVLNKSRRLLHVFVATDTD